MFLRSLKLIDTAVPDGLELHELEIYLEAALPVTYGGSALGSGSGRRQAMAAAWVSASPEVRLVGHEHRDPVEHGFQACFELRCPAVLGEPGR